MSCSHTVDCPLFAQFAMEPSLQVWKSHFCDGEFQKCARFQLSQSGKPVPLSLMPNGKQIEIKQRSREEVSGTALFNAIQKKRASMVKSMLSTGVAKVNVASNHGFTPLMLAASLGYQEITDLLLENGANPFYKNTDGHTAVDLAKQKGFNDCASSIEMFMAGHPDLANSVDVKNVSGEEAGEEEISNVVSFLKKLNPFSRK